MALDFNGTSGLINCGSASILDNIWEGGATAMAWIKPDGWGESSLGRILDKAATTFPYNGWFLNIASTYTAAVFARDFDAPGVWSSGAGSITVGSGVIYHVAVVYNSSSTSNVPTFYIDGSSVGRTVISSPFGFKYTDAAQDLIIGNFSGDTRTFDGWIADARLYDRILSASEIQTIFYARGHDAIVDNLAGRWILNEGAPGTNSSGAGVIKDLSAESNNGTPAGASISYIADPLEFNRRVA